MATLKEKHKPTGGLESEVWRRPLCPSSHHLYGIKASQPPTHGGVSTVPLVTAPRPKGPTAAGTSLVVSVLTPWPTALSLFPHKGKMVRPSNSL